MIATEQQHYPNYGRNMNNMFDVDWETLSQISRTSERESLYEDGQKLGDQAKKCSEHEKSTDLSNDWVMALGNERLDFILNASSSSSLTDGSCYSLQSEFDDLDDGIISTVSFDYDEILDSRDSSNTSDQKCEDGVSAKNAQDFIGGGSISYAQLFFDPQTKALVTLMEISNTIQPTRSCHTQNKRRNGAETRRTQGIVHPEKKQERERETPLHCSSELLSKSESSGSFRRSTIKRGNNPIKGRDHNQDEDDSPFQDDTLSTECSSLSSQTFRGHDRSRSKEDDGADWGFPATNLHPISPTRFADEPIVFSNDRSMNQDLCWLDKADVGLYLLEDCADPWEYGGSSGRGSARCGESIKRLLTASTRCISLPQLGELKWRASAPYYRTPDLSYGMHQNHKTKIERMSYSILNDA